VLAIKGGSTLDPRERAPRADLADGTTVRGETRISQSPHPIRRIRLEPEICEPVAEALDAIVRPT